MKPLSKAEISARKLETNVKRNKKRDFRKLANEMFKNPTDHLPLQSCGIGSGESAYCYHCKMIPPRITIKADKTIICRSCEGTNVEMRPKRVSILRQLYWKYKEFIYARQHKK